MIVQFQLVAYLNSDRYHVKYSPSPTFNLLLAHRFRQRVSQRLDRGGEKVLSSTRDDKLRKGQIHEGLSRVGPRHRPNPTSVLSNNGIDSGSSRGRLERRELRVVSPTLLHELKPICDATRIAHKEQTAIRVRLGLPAFQLGDFWAVRDAAADDAMDRGGGIVVLEISTRVGLPDVCGERAAGLVIYFSLEAEVVVPLQVCTECRVILERSEIDRRSALPPTKHSRSK